jgi:hypothetical protein
VAALLAIAAATLVPRPEPVAGPLRPRAWCLVCGEFGGLDLLHNALLYLPVGVAAAGLVWSWPRTLLTGFGLTVLIETLQLSVITGRDASPSDVLANTVGAMAGWLLAHWWRRWWLPRPDRAWIHGAAAGGVVGLLLLLAARLLLPAPTQAPWYGQHTARLGDMSNYHGRLLSARLNHEVLPSSLIERKPTGDTLRLEVEAIGADEDPPLIAPIGSVFDTERSEQILIGQLRRQLVFRARLKARDWRLQYLGIGIPGVFGRDPEAFRAVGEQTRSGFRLTFSQGGLHREDILAAEPGLGWALVLPKDYIQTNPRATMLVSLVWLAVLSWPVGWFAGLATRRKWLGPALLVLSYCAAAMIVGWGRPAGISMIGFLLGIGLGGWSGRGRWRTLTRVPSDH